MQNFFPTKAVEKKLQLAFRDPSLLQLAFVHRSFWNENKAHVSDHNERLEFLGDSVLGLIVAGHLFQNHPTVDEGFLSKLRSQLVDAPACAQYILQLDIGEFLLLGKGEKMNRGKGRESIMADLFEALIGALYLDQGFEAARHFFLAHFEENMEKLVASPQRNWKAELQDWTQKNFQQTPLYEVLEEFGPAHKKKFRVAVWVLEEKKGEGLGTSKKEAQFQAAKDALLKIEGKAHG